MTLQDKEIAKRQLPLLIARATSKLYERAQERNAPTMPKVEQFVTGVNDLTGLEMIISERVQQIDIHDYLPENRDLHQYWNKGEMIDFALFCITLNFVEFYPENWHEETKQNMFKKPLDERLAIAGAMLAAQIDFNKFTGTEPYEYRVQPTEELSEQLKGAIGAFEGVSSDDLAQDLPTHGATKIKPRSEGLNYENFFTDLYNRYPRATQILCDWIDEYKERVHWTSLFSDGIKFHDLPLALQTGIWFEFVGERGGCAYEINMFEFDLATDIEGYITNVLNDFYDDENDNEEDDEQPLLSEKFAATKATEFEKFYGVPLPDAIPGAMEEIQFPKEVEDGLLTAMKNDGIIGEFISPQEADASILAAALAKNSGKYSWFKNEEAASFIRPFTVIHTEPTNGVETIIAETLSAETADFITKACNWFTNMMYRRNVEKQTLDTLKSFARTVKPVLPKHPLADQQPQGAYATGNLHNEPAPVQKPKYATTGRMVHFIANDQPKDSILFEGRTYPAIVLKGDGISPYVDLSVMTDSDAKPVLVLHAIPHADGKTMYINQQVGFWDWQYSGQNEATKNMKP